MKPRLIILSDLWGELQSNWVDFYQKELKSFYQITFYDCRKLGNLNEQHSTEKTLHQGFINGGIDHAVQKLIELEQDEISILACSIGGAIAWKAILKGLKIKHLYAISATRLRYETERPASLIHLFYGKLDQYKPTEKWFDNFNIKPVIFDEAAHTLYRKPEFIKQICSYIINHSPLKIQALTNRNDIPFSLLELADPSRKQIDQYLENSKIYIAKIDIEIVGVMVLKAISEKTIEIKNIAVNPQYQGKGIGKQLLNFAFPISKNLGYLEIIIATGNSSIGQLALYQKAGFEINEIDKGFFVRHYDEPIIENGIPCKHKIILKRVLKN